MPAEFRVDKNTVFHFAIQALSFAKPTCGRQAYGRQVGGVIISPKFVAPLDESCIEEKDGTPLRPSGYGGVIISHQIRGPLWGHTHLGEIIKSPTR